jgi:hypothetical protein
MDSLCGLKAKSKMTRTLTFVVTLAATMIPAMCRAQGDARDPTAVEQGERQPSEESSDTETAAEEETIWLHGDIVRRFGYKSLRPEPFVEWAQQLVEAGTESNEVKLLAAGDDIDEDNIRQLFPIICRQLSISDDIAGEVPKATERLMISEYQRGQRTASELLHRLASIRDRIGYPGMVVIRVADDYSGYSDGILKLRGEELEKTIQRYLREAGIERDAE